MAWQANSKKEQNSFAQYSENIVPIIVECYLKYQTSKFFYEDLQVFSYKFLLISMALRLVKKWVWSKD